MRVAFDVSILGRAQFLPVARSGIYRYADNLLQALAKTEQCELSLTGFGYSLDVTGIGSYLAKRDSLRRTELLVNPLINLVGNTLRMGLKTVAGVNSRQVSRTGFLRKLHQAGDGLLASAQQSWVPLLASKLRGVQIFHSPFLHIPPASRRIANLRRCVTVHDLNPIRYPEHFPTIVNRWSRKVMENIHPDDWVVTVSQFVKDDLCERYRIHPDRVRVTPLAADATLFHPCHDQTRINNVRQKYGLGSLSPHKNIEHLVKCFAKLVQQEQMPDLHLVLAGTQGWMLDSFMNTLTETGGMAGRIIQTGFVDDDDQAALYAGAHAFVFPSLCEGFGLPPLEAMQCGTPVICANATSLPEVVGTAGLLVSPVDEDSLCQAMLDIYRKNALREQLIASGLKQARQFSWERCADDTLQTYRQALATT
jgi:glycosyltransferase involved in cell wall biosynthesis